MAAPKTAQRKQTRPQWVVTESGKPVAVLVDIHEYNDMLRRLGEIATREEEGSPDGLALLEKGEADIMAGRLISHAEVVKSVRKPKRRNG